MVYILNFKDPTSFLIGYTLNLHPGLKSGPSDLEANDVPMCHHDFLYKRISQNS